MFMVVKKSGPGRQSTRDFIKEAVMERILQGTYVPGERLVELQIAEDFGTSQGPVREALRDLEALGLVESQPYRGTRVRDISDQEIEDSYPVRGVLEQLAAELAAPHLRNNTAEIEKEFAAFTKAAQKGDLRRYSQHDMEFHRLIVDASRNQLLSQLWSSVVLESRFLVTLKNRIGQDKLETLAAAHAPILEALKMGDSALAGQRARNLICTFHAKKKSQ
jgi:DNA-binding GntR family transcriptional regulator